MGIADQRPSPNRLWHFSLSAKAKGMSADLHLRSSTELEHKKKGFFSLCSRNTSSSSISNDSCIARFPVCDISLRLRARFFLLRVRVAAGRLRELGLQICRRPGKLSTCRRAFKCHGAIKPQLPSSPSSSCVFKGLFGWSTSVLSRLVFARKPRKGSFFACGAGLGTFVLLILHHASAWATHLPAFALNAGSCIVNFVIQGLRQKCANSASPFWQGVGNIATLFQMTLSILRSALATNRWITTTLFVVLIGLVMMGKLDKYQDFLDKRQRMGAKLLPAKLLMRLLMVIKLVKSFWVHISLIHVFLFVLWSAIMSSGVSWVDKLF